MQNELGQFNDLERAGKLHRRLAVRLWVLGLIAIAVAMVLTNDIVFQHLPLLPFLAFASFGFLLGYFFFTRLAKITWDEEKEVVNIGKFDLATFSILLIYIAYRVVLEFLLENQYHDALLVSGFSLAAVWGGMIGRFSGTLRIINRIHAENAASSRIK